MAAADFNGDGLLDLASQAYPQIANSQPPGTLVIDFGVAGGGFALQPVTYAAPQTQGYVVVGDFNGDGHTDLAVAGVDIVEIMGGLPVPRPKQLALNVYLNAGDGSFGAPATYATPNSVGIATGDFNGDGRLDIVEGTTSEPNGFGVMINNGDGTFASEVTFVASATSYVYGLAVADFNGDGIDDVATTTIANTNDVGQSNVLEVFFGTPSGSFDAPVTYAFADSPTPAQGVVGDFNGDGKPDLVMVIESGAGDQSNAWQVVVFAAPVSYGINANAFEQVNAIVEGDFNGDGISDIAMATNVSEPPYSTGVTVLESICK
jgi:hypothetical protein